MKISLILFSMISLCALLACGLIRPKEHKVIGTIEAIDTGCWVDAYCFMQISGDKIMFGRGWSKEPFGELIGFDQSKLSGMEYIGKKVEVFGKKVGEGTSIEGSKKYYIKLLE